MLKPKDNKNGKTVYFSWKNIKFGSFSANKFWKWIILSKTWPTCAMYVQFLQIKVAKDDIWKSDIRKQKNRFLQKKNLSKFDRNYKRMQSHPEKQSCGASVYTSQHVQRKFGTGMAATTIIYIGRITKKMIIHIVTL